MRKNVIIVLLGFLSLALAGINVHQSQKFREVFEEYPVTKTTEERSMAMEKRVQLEEKIRQLESELASIRTTQETSADKPPAPSGKQSSMEGLTLREMLKNPQMKEMIRAQQKGNMDMTYGSLFSYLTLSDEDLEVFKQLLVDKQMALIDSSTDVMDGSVSPQKLKEMVEGFNGKIKAFLGEEDFAVYKEYEETQPERNTVNLFKQSLDAGNQISDEQEHKLILAMHEERTNFKFSNDFENQDGFDPKNVFSEEAVSIHMDELARLRERCLLRASDILTDNTQLDQFTLIHEQIHELEEMGLKIAAELLSTKPSEKEQD